MNSTRGFEHLPLVAKALNHLYREFGHKHIKSFTVTFCCNGLESTFRTDPIIATQQLAKEIASHYRLLVTTVVATFSSTLQTPGRVDLSDSNEFFVEVQSQYRSNLKVVAAILAHEVAHIFLHRCGVRFTDTFENEVLTDTTAVYVGFGPTILNAVHQTTEPYRNSPQVLTRYFGYLTLDEYGYIIAKRDAIYGSNSANYVQRGTALEGFHSGWSRFNREMTSRPLIPRPWYQNAIFLLACRKCNMTTGRKPIAFSCPYCAQGLRIPNACRKLFVHCPTCDSHYLCYS